MSTNTESFQLYLEYLEHSLNVDSTTFFHKNNHTVLEKLKMTHHSDILWL